MAQATLKKSKKSVQQVSFPELPLEEITAFLEKEFAVDAPLTLKVIHLWERNFRIKVYKKVSSGNTLLTFDELQSSRFIQVRVNDKGKLHAVEI
jgi:hypothetical protein